MLRLRYRLPTPNMVPVEPVCHARGGGFADSAAVVNAGRTACFVDTSDAAARDKHGRSLSVVRALIGIFDRGSPEFGQGYDHDILPRGLVRVLGEIFPESVKRPANGTVQVGMLARQLAFLLVSIKTTQFGPGNDGIGFVQNQGSRF